MLAMIKMITRVRTKIRNSNKSKGKNTNKKINNNNDNIKNVKKQIIAAIIIGIRRNMPQLTRFPSTLQDSAVHPVRTTGSHHDKNCTELLAAQAPLVNPTCSIVS